MFIYRGIHSNNYIIYTHGFRCERELQECCYKSDGHLKNFINNLLLYSVFMFVLHMYLCDRNCICHLYLRYLIHRVNCMLYMYFCDIICIVVMFIGSSDKYDNQIKHNNTI